jgi:virginiamycin B lyase
LTQPKNRIVRVSPGGRALAFDLPDDSAPAAIAAIPDGNLWFTEARQLRGQSYGYIGSITPQGKLNEWRIPTPGSSPRGIAEGLDESLWFTEEYGNKIGRITQDGRITEFAVPTPGAQPIGIMAGSDGGLWFSEMRGDRIGHITVVDGSAPQITEYSLPPGSHPFSITIGPDGRVWWTGEPTGTGARVGALDLNGTVQMFDTSDAARAVATGVQALGADSSSP